MSEVRRSSRVRKQQKAIAETKPAKPSKAKRAKKEELVDTDAFKKIVKKTKIPKSLLEETAPSDNESESENESEESSGDENKNKMSMAQRIRMKIKRNANEVKSTATPEEVYDEEYDEPVKKTKSKKKTANADPSNLIKAKKRKREPSPTALGDIEGALHIGQKRYVMVKHDADAPYLDIRQYYENKSKDLVSTTRGVTLNKSQWEKICEDMPNIGRRIIRASNVGSGAKSNVPLKLGGSKRIYVNKWMGHLLVHIREFNGEKPTKMGIALKPEQYNKIKRYKDDINEMWENC